MRSAARTRDVTEPGRMAHHVPQIMQMEALECGAVVCLANSLVKTDARDAGLCCARAADAAESKGWEERDAAAVTAGSSADRTMQSEAVDQSDDAALSLAADFSMDEDEVGVVGMEDVRS